MIQLNLKCIIHQTRGESQKANKLTRQKNAYDRKSKTATERKKHF